MSFGPAEPAFAWRRDDTDEAVRLVLAGPAKVTLSCRRASGAVDLALVGRRADGAMIELHAGETWNRYLGAGVTTDGPDAPLEIQVRLNAADPVLARFADTGELTLVQGEVTIRTAGSFAQAHDAMALCRAP